MNVFDIFEKCKDELVVKPQVTQQEDEMFKVDESPSQEIDYEKLAELVASKLRPSQESETVILEQGGKEDEC